MGIDIKKFDQYLKSVEAKRNKTSILGEAVAISNGSFTIDVVPMGAPRMSRSDAWKKRPVILRYFDFKDTVREACRKNGYTLQGSVGLVFHIPVSPSWSHKKRMSMIGQPHTQKPDVDNLVKSFFDSFDGGDQHVHTLTATKVWALKGAIIVT